MIKQIIFDCFGVVVSSSLPVFFKEHGIKKEIAHQLFYDLDSGNITYQEALNQVSKLISLSPKQIDEELLDKISLKDETIALINKLKESNYKIYLFSNCSIDYINEIINKFNLESLFDKIYVSASMKIMKPDIAAYQYILNDLKIKGDETLFIDDSKENVVGALKSGLFSLVFNDAIIAHEIYDFIDFDDDFTKKKKMAQSFLILGMSLQEIAALLKLSIDECKKCLDIL